MGTGSVTRQVHHGVVRKVAVLLGRENNRERYPAAPLRGHVEGYTAALQAVGEGSVTPWFHYAGLLWEALPLVWVSRRVQLPWPALGSRRSVGSRRKGARAVHRPGLFAHLPRRERGPVNRSSEFNSRGGLCFARSIA